MGDRTSGAGAVTEKQLLEAVRDLARLTGWLVYHTHDSRRSEPGFPDLVMTRRGRLIFAELKSEKGRLTPQQHEWMDALVGRKDWEVYLWRPADWTSGHIERLLR